MSHMTSLRHFKTRLGFPFRISHRDVKASVEEGRRGKAKTTTLSGFKMGQIEWAMWANEQAMASAGVLLLGGIVGVSGIFKNWGIAVYGIVIAVLIIVFEYPRSQRRKGNTIERKFQHILTPAVAALGPVSRNYYVRFALYLLFCIPCYFILPTVLGGMCLLVTSIIYFVAAIKGEQWIPIKKTEESRRLQTLEPPSRPPPRTPVHARRDEARAAEQRI
ncbi:cytochrome b-245 light chain-like [Lingula anatina]|uniref:Cytochrome b-245 light chain n=1 Tax=Lingula anatina TaxID=7574 RepID=A0A1S3HVH8_LINAN|nr:cytochrome b-245 light chain-like [Lingula anatina]|eukprot:XP_013389064.1 cytochrome b-245 light chain-like [Lingula anatina]